VSWTLRFSEPIVLPDGTKLATLWDAVAHLTKIIPKAERNVPENLTASDLPAQAAGHNGPIEFARIATLQAIKRKAAMESRNRLDHRYGIRPLPMSEH
jgi:hypothetical protein